MANVRSGREVDAALRKKGFLRETDGDHVHYCLLSSDGRKSTVKTQISHGMSGSAISAGLISKMARQLRLTKSQFLDLIDCSLSGDDYRIILRNKGFAV